MKTLLAIALAMCATASTAQAAPVQCSEEAFGTFCAFNYGIGGNDLILVYGPAGAEKIRVVCNKAPHDWKSVGPNSQQFAQAVVNYWCGS